MNLYLNFFDVNINLIAGKHEPYHKANSSLNYIDVESNRPASA